ncbi:undecaprenyldiphospho-muramoylpentapeptide beta-N-acetylglucosaminyltransferase [Paenibacillus eucommiae]|uniref:UDP-N-acetylglucosamine--N-acetylmuramyl-(pentapeptide) pyrophosphoryl-undecaprenol N-acetylglucosamine transferase n=1 Tax=Paenibacillus eucommiae TaxID=1355755 RepID=A0ABS4IYX2_9BACL|nr:undecaprenyldiphospho-muramoylpentapeptide beta-N-acetylglucosaminyltransferase [Paenibacillus eucommiae]MBP1992794.1 UDP-N-acetylglucosamine--N-acetylmuramyl-(pentapeptide) pyrophosphoryl-undecaprenol N-acetylglucosamine transferase [Paenibacillus eucommiae]
MRTIVFTGGGSAGHVTPNLAIITRLQQLGWDIRYIGSAAGIEKDIMAHEGIPFYPISSGKLRRYVDVKNIKDPFKVAKGVYDSYKILRSLKPAIVFSKGGFVSVPVVLGSKMKRIPTIIHESDMTPGLANKLAIPFAAKVCVTFPETMKHIKGHKAVLTGLPIRPAILQGNAMKGLQLCDFHSQKPVVMVMGGSLGSQAMNKALRDNLETWLADFQIVHICGKGNLASALLDVRGYKQFEFVSDELPDIMAMADLVVSRAGSTSIYEFLALEKPMLLIPLSRQASRGDQILNAGSFQRSGYAAVLDEADLTGESLILAVRSLYENRSSFKAAMATRNSMDAVESIISLIEAHSLPKLV